EAMVRLSEKELTPRIRHLWALIFSLVPCLPGARPKGAIPANSSNATLTFVVRRGIQIRGGPSNALREFRRRSDRISSPRRRPRSRLADRPLDPRRCPLAGAASRAVSAAARLVQPPHPPRSARLRRLRCHCPRTVAHLGRRGRRPSNGTRCGK